MAITTMKAANIVMEIVQVVIGGAKYLHKTAIITPDGAKDMEKTANSMHKIAITAMKAANIVMEIVRVVIDGAKYLHKTAIITPDGAKDMEKTANSIT
ncbi:hypothetical protein [Chryseolinea lacunae]|uniref:Uncharacterized protein n=1 Tax=Chryseolinea lacunae TaxID=2801331 RepID=A0ABS1L1U9_9BACT|nr:hypothetical protein [Chryseolinea lacunae]MBL0745550.1 hypothetical protein [Chryseolinea lacunae]